MATGASVHDQLRNVPRGMETCGHLRGPWLVISLPLPHRPAPLPLDPCWPSNLGGLVSGMPCYSPSGKSEAAEPQAAGRNQALTTHTTQQATSNNGRGAYHSSGWCGCAEKTGASTHSLVKLGSRALGKES